jgi:hypothetical protein
MTTISITKLYDLLTAKVGKETAENLTSYIEEKIKNEVENKSQTLATKDDVAKLDIKISETKSELIKWMFIFWIGQIVATFGFILLFLRK